MAERLALALSWNRLASQLRFGLAEATRRSTTRPLTEPADFNALELFRALGRHDVEYVTVGGVAIQAYGGQRMTQDLDVAIAASGENMQRLAAALVDV